MSEKKTPKQGNTARRNRFHSVRDYLSSFAWDQKPRIERWLIDYAGMN